MPNPATSAMQSSGRRKRWNWRRKIKRPDTDYGSNSISRANRIAREATTCQERLKRNSPVRKSGNSTFSKPECPLCSSLFPGIAEGRSGATEEADGQEEGRDEGSAEEGSAAVILVHD